MAEVPVKNSPPESKPGRDRSPPYPFISLRTAVERLAKLEKKFGRHDAPMDKLGLAWEMNAKSSQALQTAAALKAFGLVEYKGSTKEGAVAASLDGRNYLRAQQESVKLEILRRCALKPKAISMCWARWGADRPPEEVCLDELVLKEKFTESAARTLLRVYDETVAFSGLTNGDTIPSYDVNEEELEEVNVQHASAQPVQATVAMVPTGSANALGASFTPAAGFVDEAYPLDGGRSFVVRRPEVLSSEELEEFDAWIALLQRKMKRLVQQ